MRLWVRSEYASELAVLSAWMTVFIPWNVTYSVLPDLGSLLFVRFPLFQVRYAFGVPFARALEVTTPYSAYLVQAGNTIQAAYAVWVVGAAIVGLAVLLSLAMYVAEGRTEPLRPVSLMGALLLLAGVAHAVASVLLFTRGFPGVPVPVGVVFELLFGVVLLRARRA